MTEMLTLERPESWGPSRANSARQPAVALRMVLVAGLCLGGYETLGGPMRAFETASVAALLRVLGVDDISTAIPNTVALFRSNGDVMLGLITPACSALTSMMALLAIGLFVMSGPLRIRIAAGFSACAFAFVANLVRLVLACLLGLGFGETGLMLFHDWVGVAFSMAYVLVGLSMLLSFFMPWRATDIRRYGDGL